MNFAQLTQAFTRAVEAGDGTALGALFTEDGVYHDTFYGVFHGRKAIGEMLEGYFYRDATDYLWEMRDPVLQGQTGYTRWLFSFAPRVGAGENGQADEAGAKDRVVVEGMSCFTLREGLIAHYTESFNSGIALAQQHFAPERLDRLFQRWAEALRKDLSEGSKIGGWKGDHLGG